MNIAAMLNASDTRRRQAAAAEKKRISLSKALQKKKGGTYKVVLTKEGNYQQVNTRTGEQIGAATPALMPAADTTPAPFGYSTISSGKTAYSIPTPYTTSYTTETMQQAAPIMAATGAATIPLSQASNAQLSAASNQASPFSWAGQQAVYSGLAAERDFEKNIKYGSGVITPRASYYRYKDEKRDKIIEERVPGYREQFITELPAKRGTIRNLSENVRYAEEKVSMAIQPVTAPIQYGLFKAANVKYNPVLEAGLGSNPIGNPIKFTKMTASLAHETFAEATHNPIKYTAYYMAGKGLPGFLSVPGFKIASTISRHPTAAKRAGIALGGVMAGTTLFNIGTSQNQARALAISGLEIGSFGIGFSRGMRSFKPITRLYSTTTIETAASRQVFPKNKQVFQDLSGSRATIYPRVTKTKTFSTTTGRILGIEKATPFSQPYLISGKIGAGSTKLLYTPFYTKGSTTLMNIKGDEVRSTFFKKGKTVSTRTDWDTTGTMQQAIKNLKVQAFIKNNKPQISTQPFKSEMTFNKAQLLTGKTTTEAGGFRTTIKTAAIFKRSFKQTDYTSWYTEARKTAGVGSGMRKVPKIKYTLEAPKYAPSGKLLRSTGDFEMVRQAPLSTTARQVDKLTMLTDIRSQRIYKMPKLFTGGKKGNLKLITESKTIKSQIMPLSRSKLSFSFSGLIGLSKGYYGGITIPRISQKSKVKSAISMVPNISILNPITKTYTKTYSETIKAPVVDLFGRSVTKTKTLTKTRSLAKSITSITNTGGGIFGGISPPIPIPTGEIPPSIFAGGMFRGFLDLRSKRKRKGGRSVRTGYAPDLTAIMFNQKGKQPNYLKISLGMPRPLLR